MCMKSLINYQFKYNCFKETVPEYVSYSRTRNFVVVLSNTISYFNIINFSISIV